MNSTPHNSVISTNFTGPSTDPLVFEGLAQAIAMFLEGPVSSTLAIHAGHVRLVAFADGVAQVRLGGGCQGCPSSQITLFNVVRTQLQDRFGDGVVIDVVLV